MRTKTLHLVIVVVFVVLCVAHASKMGDFVPMLKRIQFRQRRSEWSEVLPSQAPRFGIHKTVYMRGPTSLVERLKRQLDAKKEGATEEIAPEDENVKISFAFDHNRQYITPWITITAQKDNQYLTQVDFIFRYSGESIREVKYHEHYTNTLSEEESKLGGPQRIRVNYHWHEIVEKDTSSALTFLYMFSFVCASVLLLYVLADVALYTMNSGNVFAAVK